MRGNGWSRSGEGFTKTEHSHFQRLYLHSSPAESYVPLKDFRPIILSLNFHSRCCYEGQASHRSSRGLGNSQTTLLTKSVFEFTSF